MVKFKVTVRVEVEYDGRIMVDALRSPAEQYRDIVNIEYGDDEKEVMLDALLSAQDELELMMGDIGANVESLEDAIQCDVGDALDSVRRDEEADVQ